METILIESSLPIAFEPYVHPDSGRIHWIQWAEGQEFLPSYPTALCGENVGKWDWDYPIWPVDKENWCIQCLQHFLISLTGKNL